MRVLSERSEVRIILWLLPFMPAFESELSARWPAEKTGGRCAGAVVALWDTARMLVLRSSNDLTSRTSAKFGRSEGVGSDG
ncbi:hypothetical protein ACFDR8_003094 [Arthrobacter sp. MP_2.3]